MGAAGLTSRADNLELDHFIFQSKAETDHIDNLQLLCSSCNRIKEIGGWSISAGIFSCEEGSGS